MRQVNGVVLEDAPDQVNGAAVAGSDVTRTAQTLAAITGLSVPLEYYSTYEFEAVLFLTTSADATGIELGVNFSASGSTILAQLIASLTTSAALAEVISAIHTATSAILTTSAQSGIASIKGIITTGANPGNLTIEHLKVTSGTSTVKIGSYIKTRKLS